MPLGALAFGGVVVLSSLLYGISTLRLGKPKVTKAQGDAPEEIEHVVDSTLGRLTRVGQRP